MKNYALENVNEFDRLVEQNSHPIYSIEKEIEHLSLKETQSILDIGCGAGCLLRLLEKRGFRFLWGIDQSELRIRQNKESETLIQFSQGKIGDPAPCDEVDHIFLRFVLHHLEIPELALRHISHLMNEETEFHVIESDGIMFNLYTNDQYLLEMLEQIKSNFPMDLFVARKVKALGHAVGLEAIGEVVIPMNFTGASLGFEKKQYQQRFSFMTKELDEIFGKHRSEFEERYLKALERPETTLFYNKFVTTLRKPKT